MLAIAPLPCAAKTSAHPGPCHQGNVANIVDRPGTGPSTDTTGNPCTVAKDRVVVETGYRNEIDVGPGGTSILSSYPQMLVRVGLDKRDELILVPPTMSVRAGMAPPAFVPAIGTQDTGIGWKHNMHAHEWFQDALSLTMTLPSGTNGYSATQPGFTITYDSSFPISGRLGVAAGAAVSDTFGYPSTGIGAPRRYLSFQPSLTLFYSLTDSTTLYVNDNVSVPDTPSGNASNVLLIALQHSLGSKFVVDVESEYNLTPVAGYRQRAIGFGGAFLF